MTMRLLRPVAIVLLETRSTDEVVVHLKKRLRLPKSLAKPIAEYYRWLKHSMTDEELLLHRLCRCPKSRHAKWNWEHHYGPVQKQLLDWLSDRESKGKLRTIPSPAPQMQPTWERWSVPPITTLSALAEYLGLSLHQLEGLADLHGIQKHLPLGPRHHYRYRWVPSRRGKVRLLEIPKLRLKNVQRKILHGILDQVPPHVAVHGFRAGRSIVTNAAQHLKQEVVISFDLAEFFPSVHVFKVMAIFRRMGYPRIVARYLAALCTKTTPDEVWRTHPRYDHQPEQWLQMKCWRNRHLPQGAPTSPALANLAAYHLDLRLAYLAEQKGWHYTRYADDLTLSGDRSLGRTRLSMMTLMHTIVEQEGFRLNLKKTHLMRPSQRQEVCGIVVNQKCNLRRGEYDKLKAILHNCAKHGVESQNWQKHPEFLSYLRGKIAMLSQVHATRAEKLMKMWETVKQTRSGGLRIPLEGTDALS